MKKYDNQEVKYEELFTVEADGDNLTCSVIGIAENGDYLYIKEEAKNVGNAYYLAQEFFLIDKSEYEAYYEIAKRNGKINNGNKRQI